MSKSRIWIVAIVIIVVGYIFSMPYITVYMIKDAAESKDGEMLSEYVEFPALRQNLKDQMNVMFMKEMTKKKGDNPFAVLGVAFGGMMVDKMVEAYVTPAGITELMKGGKPSVSTSGSNHGGKSSSEPFSNTSMSYESFSKFSVTIKSDQPNEQVKFILRRQGLVWKLTEIMLPL